MPIRPEPLLEYELLRKATEPDEVLRLLRRCHKKGLTPEWPGGMRLSEAHMKMVFGEEAAPLPRFPVKLAEPIGIPQADTVIAVYCQTSMMTAQELQWMYSAGDLERAVFCKAWGLALPTYIYDPKEGVPFDRAIYLTDEDPPDEGALGEHDEESGIPKAYVYVGYELRNGAQKLVLSGNEPEGTVTVASVFVHEDLEMLRNPYAEEWWDGPLGGIEGADGNTYASVAAEVSDPVQGELVQAKSAQGIPVHLANWVLPAWHDAEAKTGPYDRLGVVQAPFHATPEGTGYMDLRNAPGTETAVFGEWVPGHRRELHHLKLARKDILRRHRRAARTPTRPSGT